MATITLDKVDKVYENGFHAVHDLDLQVDDGEFLVLVGPSGCGKSTALRMIAGLETISDGHLFIGGNDVTGLEPKDRDIAMVFQSYALYPHLTVRDNIAFPLQLRKMPKDEIVKRVAEASRILELDDYLDRKPGQLSGGQRQRVAMGRAIVRQPKAFLMDEPLSNLDAKLRVQMRAEISRLQHSLGVTTVYVTHDQIEAMTMGDKVCVLDKGVLQQVASPQVLYDAPDNLFVASFIGSPPMNLVTGTFHRGDVGGSPFIRFGSQQLGVPTSLLGNHPALANYEGRAIAIGIRPEHVEDAALRPGSTDLVKGTVEVREGLGSEVILHVAIDAEQLAGAEDTEQDTKRFVARVDPHTRLQTGDAATLAVDTRTLHLFDLETGQAIRD